LNQQEGTLPASLLLQASRVDTPAHEAAKRGNVDFLKDLLTTQCSINTLDSAGNSPLYWAARSGHLGCVRILMTARPILDQQNNLGDTVLHGASWGGHTEIVKLLLEYGDSEQIKRILPLKNRSGQTAFDLARNVECGAILQAAMLKQRRISRAEQAAAHNEGESDSD
jgi:ankyrin repeat protein